jgi:hypothetical protein
LPGECRGRAGSHVALAIFRIGYDHRVVADSQS